MHYLRMVIIILFSTGLYKSIFSSLVVLVLRVSLSFIFFFMFNDLNSMSSHIWIVSHVLYGFVFILQSNMLTHFRPMFIYVGTRFLLAKRLKNTCGRVSF